MSNAAGAVTLLVLCAPSNSPSCDNPRQYVKLCSYRNFVGTLLVGATPRVPKLISIAVPNDESAAQNSNSFARRRNQITPTVRLQCLERIGGDARSTGPGQLAQTMALFVMVGNPCSLYNEAPATIGSGYKAWAPVFMSKTS
jgi:hypothetical protein